MRLGRDVPAQRAGEDRAGALARASLARKQERVRTFSVGFLPHMVMLALFAFLLMLEPDFGTAVVLAAVTFGMLFVAGAPLRHLLAVAVARRR